MASETKRFSLRVLLTVTTGRLLTAPAGPNDNGIGALYELLNWMTSDNLFTHQLPRALRECKPWLLRLFPELAISEAGVQNLVDTIATLRQFDKAEAIPECIENWLRYVQDTTGCNTEYDVPRIPRDDHQRIDPYDELVQMRGTDEGIVILGEEESDEVRP